MRSPFLAGAAADFPDLLQATWTLSMSRSFATALASILAISTFSSLAFAQTTTRVSVSSAGVQANGSSSRPSMSADERFVAFESAATNLVANDTNGMTDVFVHDRQSGTTVRVSVDSAGLQATGQSNAASISGDGRMVAFLSTAANLVAGDTNGTQDVFVHDRQTGTTIRASTSTSGAQANSSIDSCFISANGRFVAFASSATNLVAGDTGGFTDIFVRDLLTGVVSRVNVDASGNQANNNSFEASLSGDGRYVAFSSVATNFGVPDVNGVQDIYVHDRFSATTFLASVSSGSAQGNGASDSARISNDGRYIAFRSSASNLVANDTNFTYDIFRRDLLASLTSRVSATYTGAENDNPSDSPSLSGDGRVVAYRSSGVLPGSPGSDWFSFDTSTNRVLRVGTASGGIPGTGAGSLTVSATGALIVFQGGANYVPGDTNGVNDIFVSDPSGQPWVPFCFGDGTATACPCGNASAVGAEAGCVSSLGSAGKLTATGTPSVGSDDFILRGSGMGNGPILYFQGTAQFGGGLGAVFGDGLRCVGGTVVRLEIVVNSGGVSQYPRVGDPAVSVKGMCIPGVVRMYQGWYRDSAMYCAPETFNLTNGVTLAWRP